MPCQRENTVLACTVDGFCSLVSDIRRNRFLSSTLLPFLCGGGGFPLLKTNIRKKGTLIVKGFTREPSKRASFQVLSGLYQGQRSAPNRQNARLADRDAVKTLIDPQP